MAIRFVAGAIEFGDTSRVRGLLLTSLLLFCAPALADAGAVAVAPLEGLGLDASVLTRLDGVVRARVQGTGADVKEAAGAPCGGDVACLAALGRKVGAARVVSGSVALADDTVHVVLKIVDVAAGVETRAEKGQTTFDQLEPFVRGLALKLLDPEAYNTSSSILVDVAAPGATVLIDGTPRGTAPLIGPIAGLPPGRREVEVRAAGLTSWRGYVDAPVDGMARVRLVKDGTALVEPGAAGEVRMLPEPGGAVPPLVWAGGGAIAVGLACGVGSVVAYVAADDARQRYIGGEHEAAVLETNQSASTAFAVLTPLAVVGVGGGVGVLTYWVLE